MTRDHELGGAVAIAAVAAMIAVLFAGSTVLTPLYVIFCGNALPVIGIGILSTVTSATTASLALPA
jgi:hypothetical protein